MLLLKTWLEGEYGRGVKLAKHLNVPASFISSMADGRKPVPIAHGAAIEQFTRGAVTRQQMFPADWQRIWPELLAHECASDTSTEAATADQGVQ